jgi:hypothetical protein
MGMYHHQTMDVFLITFKLNDMLTANIEATAKKIGERRNHVASQWTFSARAKRKQRRMKP